MPNSNWREELVSSMWWRIAEGDFVETKRAAVSERAALAPRGCDEFVDYFSRLKAEGPGQSDPLFPWLAEEASLSEMRWFLEQEVAGEAGFDDLVAATQIKLPAQAKLELARNYWDEMGRGNIRGMHGPMLDGLARELELDPRVERVVWEALSLGNLLVALAFNRRYTYHAIGALGVVELTAPGRAEQVNAGLKRLGVAAKIRQYYALHATLDVEHSKAWNAEVLRSLVRDNPDCATALAEGALLRLEAGALCFKRYRRELGLASRRTD